jgi:mono/diheme cytochrome c family protein
MNSIRLAAIMALGIAMLTSSARADDEAELRELQGRQSFQNNCLMCHAAPIVTSQRLTAEQWKAELTKMIGWGAPVPPEENAVLLAYLSRNYGEGVPKVRPGRITIRGAEAAIDSQNDEGYAIKTNGSILRKETLTEMLLSVGRGEKLYKEHCAKCHGADAKGSEIGTNLVAKPILNRWIDYRTIVRDGRNRMPGFKQVLDKEAETNILDWLSRRPL